MPLLRANQLSRIIDGKPIVQNVSFSVNPGEVIAITGPSGSGKTSLLRLLNRLDEPTSGTVLLNEKNYTEIPPRKLRRRLGLVLQTPFLFPGIVKQNLLFGPAQRGESLDDQTIAQWLEKVGLPQYEDRNVSTLSGGEAQRVSIARTLLNDPEILLLDEPTSALDQDNKVGVEKLIQDLISSQGLTCLIVTHDAAQATRLAGRTLLMENGRLHA